VRVCHRVVCMAQRSRNVLEAACCMHDVNPAPCMPILHNVPCRTSISELSLHRWFIGTTWAMLLVISSLLWLMYNLYPDRGLESWEKRCVPRCAQHSLVCCNRHNRIG
jgi:hypothetical protein